MSLFFVCANFTLYAQYYNQMTTDGKRKLSEIQQEAERHFEKIETGKGTGYKQYKRWEYFAKKQLDVNGYVKDPNNLFSEQQRYNRRRNEKSSNTVLKNGASWTELGPNYRNHTSGWGPGVGRIAGFAVEKNNKNHIIAGSIGGGIWKTTDKGKTWNSLTDNHGNMYVFSLAMDPLNNNVHYWESAYGRVYESVNGGATWNSMRINIPNKSTYNRINKILIHPVQTNILFATIDYGDGGLYKSVDGGISWDLLKEGSFYDVEFDPNNSDIVFASGHGVYKSVDGGQNFIEVGAFSEGAKMIGVSKANSNIVYILEATPPEPRKWSIFNALYKSTDNGVSFQKLDHGSKNYLGEQAPRDMAIAVSQTDPNEVHIGGLNSWRSLDGGISFKKSSDWYLPDAEKDGVGYCHADIDDMEFVGDELFVITDGGMFVCKNTKKEITIDYYKDLSKGLGIKQFYKLGVSQTDPVIINAGAQDNGASIYRGGESDDKKWIDWLGADGMEGVVDIADKNVVYGLTQFGALYKTIDQGKNPDKTYKDLYLTGYNPDYFDWVTPFEQDKKGAIYISGRGVHKSIDGGIMWKDISQYFEKKTTNLKIAPSNPDIIYASVYYWDLGKRSKIYRTLDGGATKEWKKLKGFKGEVNSIAIHPKDPNKIAVALSGSEQKVIVSTDGGGSWIPYSQGLPNYSPYTLTWDDNKRDGLYLGMDYGVYYRDKNMQEWQPFANNLPNVKVTELEINYADGHLYAVTYGRGAWKTPRASYAEDLKDHETYLENIQVYPNPATGEYLYIKGDKEEKVAIRLFDSRGQILRYFNGVALKGEPYRMSIAYLPKGIYFVRVNSKELVTTKKLVIE